MLDEQDGQSALTSSAEPETQDTTSEDWPIGEEGDAEASSGSEGQDTGDLIEIDGKKYSRDDLRSFIKGGLLERDYRLKTAKLAEERRQIAELRQAAEAWQTIQQYPEIMSALGDAIAGLLQGKRAQDSTSQGQVPEQMTGGDYAEYAEPWRPEIAKIQEQVAQLAAQYEDRLRAHNEYLWRQYYASRESYARSNLPALKQKYPYLYEEEVVSAFRDHQDADLDTLARLSHEHWQKFVRERTRMNAEKREQNASARIATGPRGGSTAVQTTTPKDWDSARQSAIDRLRRVGELFK